MEKVYQVFVSSTYSDLKDERRRVSDTLAKAGFISVGMELFPAADQRQLDFIKRTIDRCDYYVVIVGGRYGSLADENVSYTEMEYEYARKRNIPVLAFLHGNPEQIAVGRTDQNEDKAKKLKRFRDTLATGRMVDFWNDANDLCTMVTIAVVNATNLAPGPGWVRGDQAVDPKVLQELERTRLENQTLKARIAEIEGTEVVFPAHLSGPEEPLVVRINTKKQGGSEHSIEAPMTPRYIFETTVDLIIREVSETVLCANLVNSYVRRFLVEQPPIVSARILGEDIKQMRFHLEALGLIKAESRQGTSSKYIAWTMTEKGRRFIALSKAIQR